jgi:hypothetical protein
VLALYLEPFIKQPFSMERHAFVKGMLLYTVPLADYIDCNTRYFERFKICVDIIQEMVDDAIAEFGEDKQRLLLHLGCIMDVPKVVFRQIMSKVRALTMCDFHDHFGFPLFDARSAESIRLCQRLGAQVAVEEVERRGTIEVRKEIVDRLEAGTGWPANVPRRGVGRKHLGPFYIHWHGSVCGVGRSTGTARNNVHPSLPRRPNIGLYIVDLIELLIKRGFLRPGWTVETFFRDLDDFMDDGV